MASWCLFYAAQMKFPQKKIRSILQDAFLVLGFCGIVAGAHAIYPPAAPIIGGILLIYAGIPKTKKVMIDKRLIKKVE